MLEETVGVLNKAEGESRTLVLRTTTVRSTVKLQPPLKDNQRFSFKLSFKLSTFRLDKYSIKILLEFRKLELELAKVKTTST